MRTATIRAALSAVVLSLAFSAFAAAFPTREQMWDLADAGHEKTAVRERYSLNGLWAFMVDNNPQDASKAPSVASMKNFFKVPGRWPESGKYAQNGTAVYDESGADVFGKSVKELKGAWYGRTVKVPNWSSRKVILGFRWVPTAVLVYVDGAKAGEVFFPGGEIDLTKQLTAGTHEIALYTSAKLPAKLVTVFDAPDQARTVTQKEIGCKGINGDVYLAAEPKEIKIDDVQVRSYVKDGKIEFSVGFAGEGSGQFSVEATVYDGAKKVKSFTSKSFGTARPGRRQTFGGDFKGAKVWDTDCPGNVYTVKAVLKNNGKAVDETYSEEFGFREVSIEGRNLLLNGKPVHLFPEYSRISGASAFANEEAEASFKAMRKHNFNFEIDGAYGFAGGNLAAFEASIRAASRVGMMSVCGLPHPCHYAPENKPLNWILKGPYEDLVRYEVKMLQNIPGLILWSSTHNQTGYEADQNPEIMTGRDEDVPDSIVGWRKRFRENSKAVDKLLGEVDPGRPLYHHESGKNGRFYTLNCYLDWAPIQERSDWLETWEDKGVMPLFIVEWGAPHIASWSSYRGEDNGRNIWSSYNTCKWCWLNEYNAAYLGEEAFRKNKHNAFSKELNNLRCLNNKACYYGAWDRVMANDPDVKRVTAMFMERNIRDMRARGITMILPWDIETTHFTWPKDDGRQPRPEPFKGMKDFGAVRSDYTFGILSVGGQVPCETGKMLVKQYEPLIGWIAGPGREYTTVNNEFRAGEKVEKSLLILNDTRKSQEIEYVWKTGSEKGKGKVTVKAGEKAQIPFAFTAAASGKITAGFRCLKTGWKLSDTFAYTVQPAKCKVKSVALFDPEGTAKPVLKALGVAFSEAGANPGKEKPVVIGRNALSKLPFDLAKAMDDGVQIVMLEQDSAALRKLGFRTQEHALRRLFAYDDSFAKLDVSDWRGVSTLLPWFIGIDKMSGDFPRTKWEGFDNTRVWRAGNRGTVASVLPEKPCVGNFRPVLAGGFDLQYAPVMEYTAPGQRMVISQLDICGRLDKRDGAAMVAPEAVDALAALLDLTAAPLPARARRVKISEGDRTVANTLTSLGISFEKVAAAKDCKEGDILVIGPQTNFGNLTDRVEAGVNVIALGADAEKVNAAFPAAKATARRYETFPDFNDQLAIEPAFRGISNADIQWALTGNVQGMPMFDGKDILKTFHAGKGVFIASGIAPANFQVKEQIARTNFRRSQTLVTRLIANLGGKVATGFPAAGTQLYADKPIAIDDPYRYFRW